MMNIGRYRSPTGDEATFQPGSRGRVLLNHLGVTSKREMDRLEFEALVAAQEKSYERFTADEHHGTTSMHDAPGVARGDLLVGREVSNGRVGERRISLAASGARSRDMTKFEEEVLGQFTPCRRAPIPDEPVRSRSFTLSCYSSIRFGMEMEGRLDGWRESWLVKLGTPHRFIYLKVAEVGRNEFGISLRYKKATWRYKKATCRTTKS